MASAKKLVRPYGDRKIAGVCAGIAQRYDWNVTWVRVVFSVAGLLVVGLIAYLILWVILPDAKFHAGDESADDFGHPEDAGGDDIEVMEQGFRIERGPRGG
jgi:phage shock protein PspC (stress-responsive transcriptional regulator)